MSAYEIRFISQRQSVTTRNYKCNTVSQNTLTQRSNDDGQRNDRGVCSPDEYITFSSFHYKRVTLEAGLLTKRNVGELLGSV